MGTTLALSQRPALKWVEQDTAAPPADVKMGHVCGDDIAALIASTGGGRKHGGNSVPTAIGDDDTFTIADADDAIGIVRFSNKPLIFTPL